MALNYLSCSDKSGEIKSEQQLVEAASVGDYGKIRKLLEAGVSVDADEYNKSLFYASKNYMTPLQIAAANGFVDCIQILIDYGADVNAKDRFDVTAMHMAAEKGNYLCLKALLDASADCCLPTKFSKTGCYTAVPHLGGTTPLHLAASNNHVDCVKELIQYGADYNAVDERGRTSLYIAAQAGFDECVLAHLKNAVGRDILSLPSFETFDTPLHFAVRRGMVACVKELLRLGSDVSHMNYAGCSPLHLAVSPSDEDESVCMEILKMLVLHGYNTDINQIDGAELTPLHYVCFNGRNLLRRRPEMAKFLISYGADVHIKNTRGYSLLECELKSHEEDFVILKYIVKSMLHVPRLKSLRVVPHTGPPHEMHVNAPRREVFIAPREFFQHIPAHNAHENMLANAAAFELIDGPAQGHIHYPLEVRVLHEMPVQYNEPAAPNNLRIMWPAPVAPPVGMAEAFAAFQVANEGRLPYLAPQEVDTDVHAQWEASCKHRKHLWYEAIASNPRTLQHYCRYTIRKTLGPRSLKHIKKLPIPIAMQSYLLLEYDE